MLYFRKQFIFFQSVCGVILLLSKPCGKEQKMSRKTHKLLRQSFRISGATKILSCYAVLFFIVSVLLYVIEPGISTIGEGLWYCFETATTIGFGDIAVVSIPAKILTVILSLYSVGVVAVFTAVITSFFMEAAKVRANDSAKEFLDDLEHLPDLTEEELRDLSEKIKRFQSGKRTQNVH